MSPTSFHAVDVLGQTVCVKFVDDPLSKGHVAIYFDDTRIQSYPDQYAASDALPDLLNTPFRRRILDLEKPMIDSLGRWHVALPYRNYLDTRFSTYILGSSANERITWQTTKGLPDQCLGENHRQSQLHKQTGKPLILSNGIPPSVDRDFLREDIWSRTHSDYRSKNADGTRWVMYLSDSHGSTLAPLDGLTDGELCRLAHASAFEGWATHPSCSTQATILEADEISLGCTHGGLIP